MTHVCTLIGAPGAGAVTAEIAGLAARTLPHADAPFWLAGGEACDISFAPGSADLATLEGAVRDAVTHAPVDVAVLPVEGRRKRLLIADMDSTIIAQECIDEIAAFAGVQRDVAAITAKAMNGEVDFEGALTERVALLEGLEEAALQRVLVEHITLNGGARTLVQTMRASGAVTALVSGGFTFFTARIAERAGFAVNQANTLEIADRKLTGRVVPPILGRQAKLDALHRLSGEHGIPLDETLAVGDGANDLAMIEAAGLGVALHAKPVVAARARVRIGHGDLTALLYLQGYAREAFRG